MHPWSPPEAAARSHAVSFGVLTVTTTSLHWQQRRSNDSTVLDEWAITKPMTRFDV